MATTKATTLAHTLGGISSDISTAEINRLDGLTGDIQTLLNLKAPLASPTFTGTTTVADFVPATPLSHRNMIINGGMNVYQRGSLSITQSNNGGFALDRFKYSQGTAVGQYEATMTQDALSDADIATTGQRNALKVLTTTVEGTIHADEDGRIVYVIEAQDCQRLLYGTSVAKSATLSFWAQSTVAADYAVNIWQEDGNDTITKTYTLAANTWTKVSITIPGNTLSGGKIANDNTGGLWIQWMLIAGSDMTSSDATSWGTYSASKLAYGHTASSVTNPWGTNSNDAWYITGVQLELGSATPFEVRSYGDELANCQRYYYGFNKVNGTTDYLLGGNNRGGNSRAHVMLWFPVTMRAAPAVSFTDGAGSADRATYHSGNLGNGGNHGLTIYSSSPTINRYHVTTDPYTGYDFYLLNLNFRAELT